MNTKQADQVLTEIEEGSDSFMIIGPKKGQVLATLIEKHKPKSILEVGTNLGYSSILMAIHSPPEGKITTLEIDPKVAQTAQENINKAGFENKIQIIVGDARETIKTLEGSFDFLFIDAAKKQYLTYLKFAEAKHSSKAVIVADNVGIFAQDMQEYLNYVRQTYESETIEVGSDSLEVSIKM